METNQGTSSGRVRSLTIRGGRLDTHSARALLGDATELFRQGVVRIVVDLAGVTYIDSLGVAALGALLRRAPEGAKIALAGAGDQVLPVLRVTHLHEVFPIYATVTAATTALDA
jgi:anti-sigma B factor antagonist